MRYYSSIAVDTSLTVAVGSTDTDLEVGGIVGYPTSFPFTIALDPDTAKEELCDVTGYTGTTFTVTRAVDSTSSFSHDVGARIKHVISGRDLREAQQHIADSAVHVPSQSGANGKFLTSDGSSTSWTSVVLPDVDTVTTSLMLGGM